MSSTRLFDALDALVATLQATGLVVWDGPVLTADASEAVFIGCDAAPTSDFLAASLDQDWAGLGAKVRNEKIQILCAVVATQPDDSWTSARARARTVLDAVGTALRANPSLGQPPLFVAGLKPIEAYQEAFPTGFQVRITFTVSIDTRV